MHSHQRHVSIISTLLQHIRSDPNVDFIAVYNEPGRLNVSLMGKLACLPETISTQEVTREAQLEITSTRQSMQIDGKMLLGFNTSCPSLLVIYYLSCHPNKTIVVAWVRHEERALFQRFPEVCFMDFTANTTKEKRPLYLLCFKTSSGFDRCISFYLLHFILLSVKRVIDISCFLVYVGEGAVALRAYVPNEQSWVCSLLHLVIQPKLLGSHTMKKIVLGISDQVLCLLLLFPNECQPCVT